VSITVAEIIDAARVRHWSFADTVLGDGAAVLFLNARQRVHLANHGAQIEGLVGTSMTYLTALNSTGALVVLVGGNPTYGTTYQDGYAVHVNGGGSLYIDTSEAPIATDPFGLHGGTPGFPLPNDFVRLINVALIYTQGVVIPCDVVPERARHTTLPGRNPTAFVSGNRLVPLMPNSIATNNSGNRWYNVSAIEISYVAIQTLATLADIVMLPAVLCEALTADLALLFAGQTKACAAPERAFFATEATRCAALVAAGSLDLIDSAQQTSVLFRR
jgi:hypothetical protein